MIEFFLFIIIVLVVFRFLNLDPTKFTIYGNDNQTSFQRPKDFETSLLVLASVIIKADGYINEVELNYVRNYFANTYGKEKANEAFRKFRNIIKEHISTRQICNEIRLFMPYIARVQLVKFLFGVAYADGQVTEAEELEIRKIASYMLLTQHDYITLRGVYHRHSEGKRYTTTYSKNSDYEYEVLGLTESATDEEIKKRYRMLVKKYHPDRLQKASSEYLKVAKEKFQQIQSAYEKIKQKRNIT